MKNENYPLCNRCIYYEGNHSTVFGECWICTKNVKEEVFDNDWNFENGIPIVECEYYENGIPKQHVIG